MSEQIINSLEHMQPVQPKPGLFQRIQLRRQQNKEEKILTRIVSFIGRPAVAAAIIGLILLLNLAALFYNTSNKNFTGNSIANNTLISDYNTSLADYSTDILEP